MKDKLYGHGLQTRASHTAYGILARAGPNRLKDSWADGGKKRTTTFVSDPFKKKCYPCPYFLGKLLNVHTNEVILPPVTATVAFPDKVLLLNPVTFKVCGVGLV